MGISAAVNDVLGGVGGGVLAAMMVPQLFQLFKTKSARDLSYSFLALYLFGLGLMMIYLWVLDATVAAACSSLQLGKPRGSRPLSLHTHLLSSQRGSCLSSWIPTPRRSHLIF
jgi:uncharacterized protein with PQ loop repeat